MKYLIRKATLNMVNGDKLIIKEKSLTDDVEKVRAELNSKNACKTITFVYEQIGNNIEQQ